MNKIIAFLSISVFLFACGGAPEEKKEEAAPETVAAPAADAQADVSNTVELSSNDQMQFDKKEIRVKAGEKVKLTLTHAGVMDIAVMGHNFVLLAQGTDIPTFALEAMQAIDNAYIPQGDAGKAVLASTEVIGGGASTTIEFDPPAVGTYDFICSFPGHYGVMQGKFIVVE